MVMPLTFLRNRRWILIGVVLLFLLAIGAAFLLTMHTPGGFLIQTHSPNILYGNG